MRRQGLLAVLLATVVAFVLGPLAENALRQTLFIPAEDPTFVFGRPYSVGLIVLLVVIVGWAWAARRPAVQRRIAIAPPEEEPARASVEERNNA